MNSPKKNTRRTRSNSGNYNINQENVNDEYSNNMRSSYPGNSSSSHRVPKRLAFSNSVKKLPDDITNILENMVMGYENNDFKLIAKTSILNKFLRDKAINYFNNLTLEQRYNFIILKYGNKTFLQLTPEEKEQIKIITNIHNIRYTKEFLMEEDRIYGYIHTFDIDQTNIEYLNLLDVLINTDNISNANVTNIKRYDNTLTIEKLNEVKTFINKYSFNILYAHNTIYYLIVNLNEYNNDDVDNYLENVLNWPFRKLNNLCLNRMQGYVKFQYVSKDITIEEYIKKIYKLSFFFKLVMGI